MTTTEDTEATPQAPAPAPDSSSIRLTVEDTGHALSYNPHTRDWALAVSVAFADGTTSQAVLVLTAQQGRALRHGLNNPPIDDDPSS